MAKKVSPSGSKPGDTPAASAAVRDTSKFPGQLFENSVRSEFLEIGERARELRTRDNSMKMVIEDHPGVNLEGFVLAAIIERANQDVEVGGGSKDGKPFHDRGSDEMSGVVFSDLIAAAHELRFGKRSFKFKCVPKLEFGNE